MGSAFRHARSVRWARAAALGGVALVFGAGAPAGAQEVAGNPVALQNDLASPIDGGELRGTGVDPTGSAAGLPLPPGPGDTDAESKPKVSLRVLPNDIGSAKLRQGPPRLPALQPYPGPARLRGATIDTVDPASTTGAPSPPPVFGPTVAALPVPSPRRKRPDLDPFGPVGYSVGSLRLTPYFEQSLGYDSNPDQIAVGVKPSAFSRSEGGFGLLSLWSSNELRANMRAGYDEFFSNPEANRPDANGTVDYRLDATRELAFDAEGRFALATQRPGSPELNVAVRGRPLISSLGTTVGGTDTLGRLALGLHGLFDRTEYENGRLADGTVVTLDDQNFNDYGISARADYELTPALKPFVEVIGDTRVHDRRLDLAGYARDSDGILGRVGSTFELTPLITGTVSAGYEDRSYEDPRLRDLRGPVVDARLIYAATPLTTFTLNASTSFNETDLVGSSGAESRSVSLQISHALLRNLTLTGIGAYLNTDYIGSTIVENTVSGTLRASYNISRSIVLDASYNHQTLRSTAPLSSFTQDVFLVGLRLQH